MDFHIYNCYTPDTAHDACRALDEFDVPFTNYNMTMISVNVNDSDIGLIDHMLAGFAERITE